MAAHTVEKPAAPAAETRQLVAYMAEFDNVDDLIAASRKVRDAGYSKWDVHSPFPIHGIDAAMGVKMTILPWIVLGGGITGLMGGLLLTYWANAADFTLPFLRNLEPYQYLISGKPVWSLPANIPVMFETTVLLAAFGAVFGMLLLNKLPMFYNPLFNNERFRRVTDDRFFVVIESADPKFDTSATAQLLESTKPLSIERVEE